MYAGDLWTRLDTAAQRDLDRTQEVAGSSPASSITWIGIGQHREAIAVAPSGSGIATGDVVDEGVGFVGRTRYWLGTANSARTGAELSVPALATALSR